MLKRPVNQITRMRAAGELAQLIAEETAPTVETENRLVKLAHRYYCTVSEIRTEYRLARSEDEAISHIYLKLSQAEHEAKEK